ncbi:LacI family DNA-binding transcriptional regulator [Rathayibacter sp. Leaf296]|uniref:LacI family DNA-binding transcriptional regulator n=1 Tax=Rathayibacter sp. Leaf296 TaxID=1736327 RepID=UPI00070339D7|nr:LacI family DNA-binding transcriptional regulator [Rathayibacter sp. Leaf296]KQQ07351.1 hypothetical protein ASF46_16900 [Rathayibacter sp. Leaf296]
MSGRSSIRDVARRASVSIGTVSNYLNATKPIAPDTAERIRAAIEELAFIPNAAVRVMQGERSRALVFLVPDLGNPFLAEVSRGIEDVALEHDHIVITCNTDGDAEREGRFAQVLAGMRVAGAIAMSMNEDGEPLQLVRGSGARIVLIGSGSDEYPTVLTRSPQAGRLAMRHLLERGHRRCVFFGGPGAAPQLVERLSGIEEAIAEHGAEVVLTRFDASGNDTRSRLDAAEELLASRGAATAVVCANDLLALALQTAALRRGLRIPEDLAIVGNDDIADAAAAVVPLTTVRHSGRELGARAAALALGREDDLPSVSPPTLIVRNST